MDFLIISLAFVFGFLTCGLFISIFLVVWFWKTIMSLSTALNKKDKDMEAAVASALEEGYKISQEQKLFVANLN